MTAHELARFLLEGPDLPVALEDWQEGHLPPTFHIKIMVETMIRQDVPPWGMTPKDYVMLTVDETF